MGFDVFRTLSFIEFMHFQYVSHVSFCHRLASSPHTPGLSSPTPVQHRMYLVSDFLQQTHPKILQSFSMAFYKTDAVQFSVFHMLSLQVDGCFLLYFLRSSFVVMVWCVCAILDDACLISSRCYLFSFFGLLLLISLVLPVIIHPVVLLSSSHQHSRHHYYHHHHYHHRYCLEDSTPLSFNRTNA